MRRKEQPIIETRQAEKLYQVGDSTIHAVDGINLQVEKGEFLCISGRSGSGKSTLLSLLAGLESPTAGEIEILGQHLEQLNEKERSRFRRAHIGFVFQSYNLLPQFSAWENVAMPLQIRGIPLKERKERAMEILDLVGLRDHALHKPTELSGGQQQRIGIARAIVTGPAIVFADEPTGNLDPGNSWEIMKLLDEINKQGTTVVVVTHNMEIVERMQKRVITMKKGIKVSDSKVD